MIWYTIWCTRYDMLRNTFAILSWETETCDPGLWSGAPHTTYYYCLCSNDAQWLQQWQPPWSPWSFQVQCVWLNSLILLDYTGCYLWYLVFFSNFGIKTVPYRIVISSEHGATQIVAFVWAWYTGVPGPSFNSSPPSAAYMHQWIRSALV